MPAERAGAVQPPVGNPNPETKDEEFRHSELSEIPKPTVVSLFTGGMGLDLGFQEVGFEIRVVLDSDPNVEATVRANGHPAPVISEDVADVPTPRLLSQAGLLVGEATVVTGAPPCEPFTTAGARNGFRDDRANAVLEFIRVVEESRPEYFVFEEVPGFVRAAKRHMSFYERSKMRDEEIDSRIEIGFGIRRSHGDLPVHGLLA